MKAQKAFLISLIGVLGICACASQPSQQEQASPTELSIPGMSRYRDEFGFSFWYPSAWSVTPQPVNNCARRPRPQVCPDNAGGSLQEGTIVRQLQIGRLQAGSLVVQAFHSPSFSIVELGATQSAAGGEDVRYFLDTATRTWMRTTLSSTVRDLAVPRTEPVSVSERTIGGLPILAGVARHGADSIVPLKDGNFVVIESMDPGNPDQRYFVRTFEPVDSSIATPADVAVRRQVIVDWRMHSEGLK